MAVTNGTITKGFSGNIAAGGTLSVSVNTTGASGLAVFLATRPLAVDLSDVAASVVFNVSESLTRVAYAAQGAVPDAQAHVWVLNNPSQTTANVVLTITGTGIARVAMLCVPLIGTDTSSLTGTTATAIGTDTAPTVTVASAASSVVYGILCHRDTSVNVTLDGDTTFLDEQDAGSPTSGNSHLTGTLVKVTGGASASPSGVLGAAQSWGIAAVEFNDAPAAGAIARLAAHYNLQGTL